MLLLSSCSSLDQKLRDAQHLECAPSDAIGCVGFVSHNDGE